MLGSLRLTFRLLGLCLLSFLIAFRWVVVLGVCWFVFRCFVIGFDCVCFRWILRCGFGFDLRAVTGLLFACG